MRVLFGEDESEVGGPDGDWGHGTITKVTKPKPSSQARSKGGTKQGRIYVAYDDGDEGFCDFPEPGIEILKDEAEGKAGEEEPTKTTDESKERASKRAKKGVFNRMVLSQR